MLRIKILHSNRQIPLLPSTLRMSRLPFLLSILIQKWKRAENSNLTMTTTDITIRTKRFPLTDSERRVLHILKRFSKDHPSEWITAHIVFPERVGQHNADRRAVKRLMNLGILGSYGFETRNGGFLMYTKRNDYD
jgi:hypothetical protein